MLPHSLSFPAVPSQLYYYPGYAPRELSLPYLPHWAPLPKRFFSCSCSRPISYKEAVCFAFPASFPAWIRFLFSCKFARISPLPSCCSFGAVGLLCSFTFPSPPCDPFLVCCIVNLIRRRPNFRFQSFIAREGVSIYTASTPLGLSEPVHQQHPDL